MLRARVALLALVAVGVLAPAAFAVGEKVDTAVKLTHGKIGTQAAKAGLSWDMHISTADGSRARSIHQGELTLPKGFFVVARGLRSCPLSTLNQNNPNACPARSVVGRSNATIVTPEVRAEPFDATGVIYFTGMKGRTPTFGVYYTLVEFPDLHSVTQIRITPPGKRATKVYMDQPPVPVPGLPDSTPTRIMFSFGKKQGVIRTNKRCRAGAIARARYGFFDQSPASHDNNVFHTQITDPVAASDPAC
jgi:hypothetical protein